MPAAVLRDIEACEMFSSQTFMSNFKIFNDEMLLRRMLRYCFALTLLLNTSLPPANQDVESQLPPSIIEVTPRTFSCDSTCILGNIKVKGHGFDDAAVVHLSHGKLLEARYLSASELVLSIGFDSTSYSPGWIDISISTNKGMSNLSTMAFLGNTNTLVLAESHCFNLDQGASVVWDIDCDPRHSLIQNKVITAARGCFIGASLANGIAWDDKTKLVLLAKPNGILIMRMEDCAILQLVDTINVTLKVTEATVVRK